MTATVSCQAWNLGTESRWFLKDNSFYHLVSFFWEKQRSRTPLSWTGIAAYAVEGCYVSCIITGYGGRPLSFLLIAEHFRAASIPLALAWNWSIIWQTGLSKRRHPTLSALSFAYFNIRFYFICICNWELTALSFPSFSCWPWRPRYAETQHNIGALGSDVRPSHRGDVLLRKWPC